MADSVIQFTSCWSSGV